ncbi:MAG: sn-glycerol-3-phosphate ABC transporter ATP-binding protein UgpC [Anaeroplasmataceae bacterium]|nr:sn-glycerol-3-phosphate ABC transporter ATP-binding protein UgpC [Anaeroplasmataceae bacterium]MDE5868289.1 sn-glycerol-3-phosphate ABC transporter ATP-binding protein UgpC [Anaeroplasmataceae bacterium]
MATLDLIHIDKIYPNGVQAVFDFNLKIEDKEFIVFVGPSGCGKSTTLRMIAGLEDITSGELYIDNVLMNHVSSKDRGIAMVFQSYALYPHMTIYNNLAFGLKLRRVPRDEIERRVAEAAKILGLENLLDRYPRQLSGGQNQRVALGRAIVRHASVFLMDEPLSNLDAKLRVTMRGELTKLHRNLGSTTIYVTHDQIEAMTMASRIVVMRDGRIQQVGTPKEIYEHPANVFVGGFIGTPPMNFIHGTVAKDGKFTTKNGAHTIELTKGQVTTLDKAGYIGKEVILGIRPEDIYDNPVVLQTYSNAVIEVTVDVAELLGAETNIYANVDGDAIIASVPARDDLSKDSVIKLAFDMNHCHIFDVDTEETIF